MDDNLLYPLKFIPIFKEKIWGGTRIKTSLGLNFGRVSPCGEAWMLSGIDQEESVVANGFLEGNTLVDLVEVYMGDLVGEKNYQKFGLQFPLLFKWIDAEQNLSVQVHPNDALAKERHQCLGKSEMWFMAEAEKGAELICGFQPKINQMQYLKALEKGDLEKVLLRQKVEKGGAFYIPAGTVHALGKGLLLAEIQQCSDITYRIYDWNRKDAEGKSRELHTELALQALRFEGDRLTKELADTIVDAGRILYGRGKNRTNEILNTPYFQVNYLCLDSGIEKDFSELDSFVVYLCLKGKAVLKADSKVVEISQGELVLIPAICNVLAFYPDTLGCELLETYIL
ncbi:MAG: type I phosphomannose isomerase catalytic subunit [Bacteroidales bacterium]